MSTKLQQQAYFLSWLLGVIVSLYPDPHHARLVNNLLDDLPILPNYFTLGQGGEEKKKKKRQKEKKQ